MLALFNYASANAVLYRMESVVYAAPLDEFEIPCGRGRQLLSPRYFEVLRYTACGAWIRHYGEKKFVNLRAAKQYACGTPEEAVIAFRARKAAQIRILSAQLERAEEALRLLDGGRLP